jgi:hypothetical protein
MSKELYLLVDGTYASPDDCDVGADNELRHKDNGVPVALREDGTPQTLAQGTVENMNVEAAEVGVSDAPPPELKDEPVEADKLSPEPDDDLLLTTDDMKPDEGRKEVKVAPAKAKEVKPAKAKSYKNRELKAR